MLRIARLAFVAALAITAQSHGSELLLTAENWQEKVLDSKHVAVVEYFSNMCGSCKEFSPTWEQLAASLSYDYLVARVSIDSKEGMKLAKDQGILQKGIPAVQVVAGSSSDILMAGRQLDLATLKSKVKSAIEKYGTARHAETGLRIHSEL